jgi:hypothetical protein
MNCVDPQEWWSAIGQNIELLKKRAITVLMLQTFFLKKQIILGAHVS